MLGDNEHHSCLLTSRSCSVIMANPSGDPPDPPRLRPRTMSPHPRAVRSLVRRAAPAVLLLLLSSCERGCARDWLVRQGVGPGEGKGGPPWKPASPLNAVDCPDGLARCTAGVVEVSLLTSIPQPCTPPSPCSCPWSVQAYCEGACVAEGAEVVIERPLAARQLCAPSQPGGAVIRVTPAGPPTHGVCEDGQLFRCSGADVVDCRENAIIGTCIRGCFAPDAYLEGDAPVSREAAFAILCSR
jgi:hypothetical protein